MSTNQEIMHEKLDRSETLPGATYKIKPPASDHAIYVTINNMMLNQGTDQEQLVPYEIFINSKNIENYQWIFALTRVLSATFRKGGEINFLINELKETFDPKGGYFKRGGIFMPSIVAELGYIIEKHMQSIGLNTDTNVK